MWNVEPPDEAFARPTCFPLPPPFALPPPPLPLPLDAQEPSLTMATLSLYVMLPRRML